MSSQSSGQRHIPRTTLCCIDCQLPDLALQAIEHTLKLCSFECVLFFTDRPVEHAQIECVQIPRITSSAEYSFFVLQKLADYLDTDFVLLIQWDGFVINADAWRDEFFQYDYIGAPWPHRSPAQRIGNGGFSLRSTKLMKLAQRIDVNDPHHDLSKLAEDEMLCLVFREMLENDFGIRFAPEHIGHAFSFERFKPTGFPFGFHGLFNAWATMSHQDVEAMLPRLPDAVVLGQQCIQLGVSYYSIRQYHMARAIFNRLAQLKSPHPSVEYHLAELEKLHQARPRHPIGRNDACPCGSELRHKACCGEDMDRYDPARAHDLQWMLQFAQHMRDEKNVLFAAAVLRLILAERPQHAPARRHLESVESAARHMTITNVP